MADFMSPGFKFVRIIIICIQLALCSRPTSSLSPPWSLSQLTSQLALLSKTPTASSDCIPDFIGNEDSRPDTFLGRQVDCTLQSANPRNNRTNIYAPYQPPPADTSSRRLGGPRPELYDSPSAIIEELYAKGHLQSTYGCLVRDLEDCQEGCQIKSVRLVDEVDEEVLPQDEGEKTTSTPIASRRTSPSPKRRPNPRHQNEAAGLLSDKMFVSQNHPTPLHTAEVSSTKPPEAQLNRSSSQPVDQTRHRSAETVAIVAGPVTPTVLTPQMSTRPVTKGSSKSGGPAANRALGQISSTGKTREREVCLPGTIPAAQFGVVFTSRIATQTGAACLNKVTSSECNEDVYCRSCAVMGGMAQYRGICVPVGVTCERLVRTEFAWTLSSMSKSGTTQSMVSRSVWSTSIYAVALMALWCLPPPAV